MLKLPIAMMRAMSGFVLLLGLLGAFLSTDGVRIDAPVGGEALKGMVAISGEIRAAEIAWAEISFTYAGGKPGTWFLIQELKPEAQSGVLANWDTSAITDGAYDLRLMVRLKDGVQQAALIEGVRVRNYTPVETSTPPPALAQAAPAATATPPPPFQELPTPTRLPVNPAQITSLDITSGLVQGAGIAAALLVLFGVLLALRARLR